MGVLFAMFLAIFGMQLLTAFFAFEVPHGLYFLVVLTAIMIARNNKNKNYKRPGSRRNYERNSSSSSAKMTKFNKALRTYFETNDELALNEHIIVRPASLAKNRNVELDVFYDNEFICKFSEFSEYFAGTHAKMIDKILAEVSGYDADSSVEVEEEVIKKTEPKVEVKKEEPKDNAAYFIKVIDELNIDIKEEAITNDLYETTAMLKQIEMIEDKYPNSKEKLTKLYQYYLPVLVNILNKYVKLVTTNSKHDDIATVEEKLRKTIFLVNEALKTITMQLCEEDIIDLNSDMSVLESILKRDGLVKEGTIYEKSVSESGD